MLNVKKVRWWKNNVKIKRDDVPEIMLSLSCLCYHAVHMYNILSFDLIFFFYCFWFHAHTPIKSIPYFKNKRSISIIFCLVKIQVYASHRFIRCYSPGTRFYCWIGSSSSLLLLSIVFFRVHFLSSASLIL